MGKVRFSLGYKNTWFSLHEVKERSRACHRRLWLRRSGSDAYRTTTNVLCSIPVSDLCCMSFPVSLPASSLSVPLLSLLDKGQKSVHSQQHIMELEIGGMMLAKKDQS